LALNLGAMSHTDPPNSSQNESDTSRIRTSQPSALGIPEQRLLWLLSAVQFVNVLDFVLVMPLGPDFAEDLKIPLSHLGWIGGAYTAAASVVGLVASRFLDRFDRRSALATSLLGLVIATACGGISRGLYELMAARVLAGAFGGPATSLSLSIVADVVPPARRGHAIGIVMGAFSIASVLGLPLALELSRIAGWRWAFFSVAGMGLLVAGAALFSMPRLRLHLQSPRPDQADARTQAMLAAGQRESRQLLWYALASTFTVMVSAFSVIPNIATYVQANLHYPREQLGTLYFVGGICSFVAMRALGPLADRFGAASAASLGTLCFVAALALVFIIQAPVPPMLFYVVFMSSMAMRGVAFGALSTRVPRPHERARFMSLQSAVQHAAAAFGAVLSAQLLTELPDKALRGMDHVAWIASALALVLPAFLWRIEQLIARRDQLVSEASTRASTPHKAAPTRAAASDIVSL